MALFGRIKINTKSSAKETNSFGEDMNRLTKDGELPWGWLTKHKDFTDTAQAEVMYFYKQYGDNCYGEPKKKYAALKSLLLYIEDAKRLYAQKGECFLYWFVSIWAKEDEVDKLYAELRYIEEHISELEEKYKKMQNKKGRG